MVAQLNLIINKMRLNYTLKNMTKIYLKLSIIILLIFCFGACSEDTIEVNQSSAAFIKKTLNIPSSAGEVITMIEWSATPWEIVMDSDNGMIIKISKREGGDTENKNGNDRITIGYSENKSLEPRSQELYLVNKTTGERSKLVITQEGSHSSVSLTIDKSTKYQHVVGFGGMYNPVIWHSSDNLITNNEIIKMYSPDQLGYNILRLMIYPNENDWTKDVEGAKLAQSQGAIVFASPWYSPDELAETIIVNGEEYRHLNKENYQAYTDHLIRYIDFMKSSGVDIFAVSVQNEPDINFTFWYPNEIVEYIKDYGDQIRATGVKLMAPEACGTQPEYTDAVLNDPEAFEKTDIIAGHLYQGFINVEESSYVKNRHNYISGLYNNKLAAVNKTWWMTEHLYNHGESETNPSLWEFQKWSYNMDHLGKEIHMCMEGYCSAYIYWYLKRFYGMIGDNDGRSPVGPGEIAKNGYILSHYAKYASNMTRIKIDANNPDLMTTAYINPDESFITVVLLNFNNSGFNVQIASPDKIKRVDAVETTEIKNMQSITSQINNEDNNVSILLSGKSIASVMIKLK